MSRHNEINPAVVRPIPYTVTTVPAASSLPGGLIFVSNGNAGQPTLAFSDGTNWKVLSIGATIS
jgi:hypothetical protein